MKHSDMQAIFLEHLGVRIGDEMTDYLVRRFQEGGAAIAPIALPLSDEAAQMGSVRRFVELADALGDGIVIPAESSDPLVH